MPEKIYRTGIYARLSREDNEHGESNSISSQKAICMEYISRHPDLELVEIYDESHSEFWYLDLEGFIPVAFETEEEME